MTRYILAIDQGTTSSRAIIFDEKARIISKAQQEFEQHFPADGWVEHDPEAIWESTIATCHQALQKANLSAQHITSIGITNQRETTLVWDKRTGKPIYNAIVWQDRRTSAFCDSLKEQNLESTIIDKTGLLIDPYFSASKVKWILDNVDNARSNIEHLAFGTVDSFLLWRLTGGQSHFTDATNAARTQMFNIHTQQWDDELLQYFDIPKSILPEVLDCSADFGHTHTALFGAPIPILGIAGDQQAALIGQACLEPGMIKSTYGTGCFMILNTGTQAIKSKNRMLTTVAYRLNGQVNYALEGSIFIAGATIQWLRDGLKIIEHVSQTEALAQQTSAEQSVYLVPAFTGLGAPYWDAQARGALLGLTRDTGIADIVAAGLQSVCYQTRDLVEAMRDDGANYAAIRIDGGMVGNNWLTQFLADIIGIPVDRPHITETTALGVAFLAGLRSGVFENLEHIKTLWQHERRFTPTMPENTRATLYEGWQAAVARTRS